MKATNSQNKQPKARWTTYVAQEIDELFRKECEQKGWKLTNGLEMVLRERYQEMGLLEPEEKEAS